MRGKPGIFGLAAGLAAVSAIALGSAQAATVHCTTGTGTTVVSNAQVRVYSSATGRSVFACLKSNGHTRHLAGAIAGASHFAVGGAWVAWTANGSATQSEVRVMHVTNGAIPSGFPFDTNDTVNKVVVKSDGAAAWAATPSDYPNTLRYVQGTDRSNHSPDQFSDDTKDVKPATLHSDAGHQISWQYTDGSTGTAQLF
jgi:hypothetical protein